MPKLPQQCCPQTPKYWCTKCVATHLNLEDERTAAKLLRTGEIEGWKISGRIWRTTEWQVEAYAKRKLEEQRRRRKRAA